MRALLVLGHGAWSLTHSPFHVSSLGATQSHDTLLGQHVQTERVDALLIDDDKVLLLAHDVAIFVELRVAHELLEFDNFANLGIGEAPFGLDELLPLLG